MMQMKCCRKKSVWNWRLNMTLLSELGVYYTFSNHLLDFLVLSVDSDFDKKKNTIKIILSVRQRNSLLTINCFSKDDEEEQNTWMKSSDFKGSPVFDRVMGTIITQIKRHRSSSKTNKLQMNVIFKEEREMHVWRRLSRQKDRQWVCQKIIIKSRDEGNEGNEGEEKSDAWEARDEVREKKRQKVFRESMRERVCFGRSILRNKFSIRKTKERKTWKRKTWDQVKSRQLLKPTKSCLFPFVSLWFSVLDKSVVSSLSSSSSRATRNPILLRGREKNRRQK